MSATTIIGSGNLDRIYDQIEAVLPGVMHPVVQMELFNTFEEFCTRSTYWRELLQWDMAIGETELDLNDAGLGFRVHWVLNVCGLQCHRIMPQAIIQDLGDGAEARTGTAWVVCKPLTLASIIPDWFDDWSEAFREGVLFRLFSQPFKTYSSVQLATYYGRRWASQIRLARAEARDKSESTRLYFPYFAHGRQNSGGMGNDPCCGGGTGGGVSPGTLPLVSISEGVITDDPVGTLPVVTISEGVISGGAIDGPDLVFDDTSIDFPDTPSGDTSSPVLIVITNDGDEPATISGVEVTGDFEITEITIP